MDTAVARAIVRRVAELGVSRIVFTGGDPLKRSHIGELLDLARAVGLEVALSTTGDDLTHGFLAAPAASLGVVSLPLDVPSEDVSSRTEDTVSVVEGMIHSFSATSPSAVRVWRWSSDQSVLSRWIRDESFPTMSALVLQVVGAHIAYHAGQLAVWRGAVGKPSAAVFV